MLKNINNNPAIKTHYLKLEKSYAYKSLNHLLNKKHQPIFAECEIFKNKDYLLTLSKFIDFKINNNKKLYRSKSDVCLIENIAYLLIQSIHKDNSYQIFKLYKNNYNVFSIKQKENKLIKFLIAKFLFYELFKIESELINISLIVNKYKKRKFILNYNKNILNTAKLYSILKFNPNSTRLLYFKNINKPLIIKSLFCELYDARKKLQTIIAYLKVMF